MIVGNGILVERNQTGDFSTDISDLIIHYIWPAVDYLCVAILVIYAIKISRNPAGCELSFDECLKQTCFNQSREDRRTNQKFM